jgi:hypothetical protein
VAAISDCGNGIVLEAGNLAKSTGSSGFAEISGSYILWRF